MYFNRTFSPTCFGCCCGSPQDEIITRIQKYNMVSCVATP